MPNTTPRSSKNLRRGAPRCRRSTKHSDHSRAAVRNRFAEFALVSPLSDEEIKARRHSTLGE